MKKLALILCAMALLLVSPLHTVNATSDAPADDVNTGPDTVITEEPITPDPLTPNPVTPDPVIPDPVTPEPPSPTPTKAPFSGPVLNVDVLTDLNKVYAPDESFELKLLINNLLTKDIKAMQVGLNLPKDSAFILDPAFLSPPKEATKAEIDKFIPESFIKTEDFPKSNTKLVTFKLKTKADLTNTSTKVPLEIRFSPQPSGDDPLGCPLITGYELKRDIILKTQMPEPSITPEPSIVPEAPSAGFGGYSGGSDNGSSSAMKNKPKLIITKYNVEPSMPKAGQEFSLKMTFYNTNQDKSCRNIKILLSTDTPATTAAGEGATQAVMNVFTPVNSSNTFYIPKIEPEQTADKEITFAVGPTVQSKNYTLLVKFEYEDADGNQLEANETIGIPIVQEAKIEADEVKPPAMAMVGQAFNLDYNVYNVGKDNLTNLMIEYVGPMTTDTARSFVGNFASGASAMYSTSLVPMTNGPVEGSIKISFEDSTGEKHVVEKPFTVQVEAMPEFDPAAMAGMDPNAEGSTDSQNKPFYMNPLVWAGVAALIALIVLAAVLKHRRAKKIEKDLTIDE